MKKTQLDIMYIFLHIGKTGGSTINNYLRRAGLKFQYLHTAHSLNKGMAGNKIFFFIRDPVARFISAFNYYRNNIMVKKWRDKDYGVLKPFRTANQFAESNIVPANFKLVHLYKTLSDYVGGIETLKYLCGQGSIYFVGRTEFLARDLLRLSDKLGLKRQKITRIHSSFGKKRGLSKLAKENLAARFSRDYEVIKYVNSLFL